MKRTIAAILLAFTILNTNLAYAQLTSHEIDQLVEDARSKFNIPGVAVGIVKDGKIVHAKGYGFSSLDTKKEVDQHTQFALASVSKAFTTTAMAILVDQGKISWKDRVIDYIPEFTMYNDYVRENFIIEDLLTHRSGLGLGAGDLMFIPDENDFTINDILSSFQYFKPVSAFRTQYDYDNLLYIVAGELIKRVSGQSWEDFVQTNILIPLGMDNSFSSIANIHDKSNLAAPHIKKASTLQTIENFKRTGNGAAGGIFSNAEDFCQWMLVQLNKGRFGSNLERQLFTEKRQREMWKPYISNITQPSKPYYVNFNGYGLGWVLNDINGHFIAHHSGGLPGISTQTILVPDVNLGIVVLSNSDISVEPISFSILDNYLGLPDNNWVDKIHEGHDKNSDETEKIVQEIWETVAVAENEKLTPEKLIGLYEDKWFGKIEVFNNEGKLWIKSYRSPKLNGHLQYYKENTFAVKWEYQDLNADAFITFSLDKTGMAQSIKMEGISPDIDFSFDFQDLDIKRIE
ncbi:serine hydrolase [Echinicola shivajiensis]|uniref:serine hydrolase n=1 Tax=Echinicola shivajiensis TaxID=1035916 RepID=UPI001FE8296E|nr:serine hydrolase [Echinicola shivajiensis]